MDDPEVIRDDPEVTRDEPAPRRGRLQVALFALAVVALIAAGAMRLGDGGSRPVPGGNPSAVLDTALEGGTPAYILIHSLT